MEFKKKVKNFVIPGLDVETASQPINIPIGALLDLLHCEFNVGKMGETIINGGLPQYTGLIGSVNNYKTTIAHFMVCSATAKIIQSQYPTMIETFDTEMSIKPSRLGMLAANVNKNLIEPVKNGAWKVSNPTSISTNEWVAKFEEYVDKKEKDKSIDIEFDAFKDNYTGKTITNKIPTFLEIDTISKFTNEKALDKLADNDLDSSDTNTVFMNIGMFKKKFLLPLPRNLTRANVYAVLTAHVSEKIEMLTGPAMYVRPSKQLQYLKGGDEIEGGTKEFKQTTSLMLQAHTAKLLANKATKQAEYPMDENDKTETDLNTVMITVLRNKSGASGITVPLVVSQSQGVLPTLTEFHYLKEVGKFGIEGNNLSYNIEILPEVKLSRTTVRKKIDNDPILRRAINITSELFQIIMTRAEYREMKYATITPKALYNKIKDMGYEWNKLLDTRGYWLIDQYDLDIDKPFLSTPDIINMYLEEYHPWWYPKDGITNACLNK